MRTTLLLILFAAFVGGCASTGSTSGGGGLSGGGIDPNASTTEKERQAYGITGDVRVFYYVKDMMVDSAFQKGEQVEQKKKYYILANKSHSAYMTKADQEIPPEVHFLNNTDMYDMLRLLKERDFFAPGNSVNIYSEDPVARADGEYNTQRVIAVQVSKNGKVDTSYFARRSGENVVPKDKPGYNRSVAFNKCQEVVVRAVVGALPRGTAGQGKGDKDQIGKKR